MANDAMFAAGIDLNLGDMLGSILPKKTKRRKLPVREARRVLLPAGSGGNGTAFESVRLPSVWKLEQRGSCARYAEYTRFYADAIDENAERRRRKCPGCPAFSKKENRIVVDGECRFHVLRELSEIASFSSLIIVPDLNLQKYAGMEVIEEGLELVDELVPDRTQGDFRSIHVFRRSRTKKWTQPLPP